MIPAHTRIEGLEQDIVVAVNDSLQGVDSVVKALARQVRLAIGEKPPVAIFGTAREADRLPRIYERFGPLADQVGKLIAEMGLPLLSGWCTGMPHRVERAFELQREQLGVQLPLIGIHIDLTDRKTGHCLEERSLDGADIYFKAPTFDLRTMLMLALSEACIVFPGGIGSLLELSRYLQQQQLHCYTDGIQRTIILVGSDFWAPTIAQLETMVDWGTVGRQELDQLNLRVVDDVNQVAEALTDHLQMVNAGKLPSWLRISA